MGVRLGAVVVDKQGKAARTANPVQTTRFLGVKRGLPWDGVDAGCTGEYALETVADPAKEDDPPWGNAAGRMARMVE